MQRAEALIAKSAGLSFGEAVSKVCHDDPDLYRAYTQHSAGTPTADTPPAPVVKVVQHPLADDLLSLAKAFRPNDPTGEGMVMCRRALELLRETVERKKRQAA
jgi:hypothetical protein